MAPADKTEHVVETTTGDRSAGYHEGLKSGAARGYTSPLLGDARDHTLSRSAGGRTGFDSAGGWVVCL